MNPKIVVTDYAFPDLSIEQAVLAGCELTRRQCKTEADLLDLCKDADAVITQFARVNANVIAGMARARAIVRYGIGVDNVDLAAAGSRGIPVCNVPDYCIDEVADHTLAFILALTRQVVIHTDHLRSGKWSLVGPLANMKALAQLTVGVIGFGRIGREVVRRLAAFKCAILVFDPFISAEEIRRFGQTDPGKAGQPAEFPSPALKGTLSPAGGEGWGEGVRLSSPAQLTNTTGVA